MLRFEMARIANPRQRWDIINFYIESIASTEYLNEEEKEALICSFSVASESLFLWLNQYNNETSN